MSDAVQFDDVKEYYDHLEHIGTKRHSGRYPWGSGDNAYQRNKSMLQYITDMEKGGMTQAEIAKVLGVKSSKQVREMKSIASNAVRREEIDHIRRLHDKNMSNSAIARQLGINESTVRSRLKPELDARASVLDRTADNIRDRVDEVGYVDVGAGTELYLGVSKTRKDVAIAMLEDEGYKTYYLKSTGPSGNDTTIKVIGKPDSSYADLAADPNQVNTIGGAYSRKDGEFRLTKPPVNLNSDRIGVRYAEEGGADMDGVIQLRRGVDDVSLGERNYAQVRIAVDGTHYLKGMAMYSDNMPDGVDVVFNTNKSNTGNKLDAMKKLARDSDNPEYIDEKLPFGSLVVQKTYVDKNGAQQQSVLNIVGTPGNENIEGRWNQWSKNISSQMLSKQSPSLAKKQLDLTFQTKKDEFEDIMALTNPVVKKKMLEEFADGADASAVHLKAAGLPRTRNQVILPINSLKDGEVYAPNFNNGEKVVLLRSPHGGIFEIPELTVNNKNREALSVIKQAKDAVGINSKVAAQLSGADFDGDTVLVIPNNNRAIKTSPPLAGLKNFDPQADYRMPKGSDGKPVSNGMTPAGKQKQMGVISNLITDMTIKGANHAEIARAVRHSMVVIDAEKHNLDYKRSAKENGIAELKRKYQYDPETDSSGAATIISRAKSEARVLDRKPRAASDGGPIDPVTGKKMWTYSNESYTKTSVNPKTGAVTEKVVMKPGAKSTKMAEADDAFDLVSKNGGTLMERVYAEHANRLKAIANQARKESLSTKAPSVNPTARKTYAAEVDSLTAKLRNAQKNAPLERKALLAANAVVDAKKKANPSTSPAELKKLKALALEEARLRLGAKKETVTFTEREWEAVQNNAVSSSLLKSLLANTKADHVKELATPRDRPVMTSAKMARAKAMQASGYTNAEIAAALGVPGSTLDSALDG